jgi:peptidoglycan/LPS O-acetylase OafA/YrhL
MAPIRDVHRAQPNNIGFLRLFFALLVIASHAPQLVDGNNSRELLTQLFHTLTFGYVAVDGFFIISGYLVTKSFIQSGSLLEYMSNRVLRIYPAFIISFLISVFVVGGLFGAHPYSLTSSQYFRLFARLIRLDEPPRLPGVFSLNGAMWTIGQEFRCYLLVVLFAAVGLYRRRWLYLIAALAVLALSVAMAAGLKLPSVPVIIPDTHQLVRLVAMFMAGAIFYLFRDHVKYSRGKVILASVALFGLMFLPKFADLGIALFGSYLIFYVGFNVDSVILRSINNKTDISYGVYLYAWPITMMLIASAPGINPVTVFLVTVAGSVLCGMASWYAIERPALALRKYARRARSPALAPATAVVTDVSGGETAPAAVRPTP